MDMSKQRVISPIYAFFPTEVEGFDSLAKLALDMHWYWNHSADEVWRELDPALWELTYNPWVVLQSVSHDRLRSVLADSAFRKKVDDLLQARQKTAESPAWFQQNHSEAPITAIAYFSMEFMLSEALPIYSGGLGNVAGDQLKTASDLGVPVIGVGLLYQQGYFRQEIDRNGAQKVLFPYNDPGQLPITPVRQPNGEWLRLELELPGYSVVLRAWQVRVGRAILYLLDSNDPANFPARRGITSELYGGGQDLRLNQELVLGIGGWRLLHALGIKPEVCHLNEGHAAFVILERALTYMEETGQPFEVALTATKAGNLFTTHTAVAAGFDRFPPALIEHYLGIYAQKRLGISVNDLLALGRQNPEDPSEPFNMAYLAIRGSGAVNGVSRLHGQVSRQLFEPLFPRWPQADVPVAYVTNGVHMGSWDSEETDSLWTDTCGKERWLGDLKNVEDDIHRLSDSRLWECRDSARESLIEYVRGHLFRQLEASGALAGEIEGAKHIFDPNTLTLGFARRFATYKRPNLLLSDPERLRRILTNPARPVQLIIAGKAHPADQAGQDLIRQWTSFIKQNDLRKHVVFLSDYDMLLTGELAQGVDIWINTPRRPWEACGTSGMKVLVNGGLNISELDGWWAEAYTPEVGWALGDGKEHGDDPNWDSFEADTLYSLLETEVIPEFYNRDRNGIPVAWVSRIRESMARLTPRFSANRAVREYTEKYYIPGALAYLNRARDKGVIGSQIVNWRRAIEQNWSYIRFGEVKVKTTGKKYAFEVPVYLGGLDPDAVRVELYADGLNGSEPVRVVMTRGGKLAGAGDAYIYSSTFPASRLASDYTARVIPYHPGVSIPLEAKEILWQR
jgi:starch phosphorylase